MSERPPAETKLSRVATLNEKELIVAWAGRRGGSDTMHTQTMGQLQRRVLAALIGIESKVR